MSLLKRVLSKLSRRHSSEFSDELESNIHFMQDPLGDPLHLQRAEQALEFLLDHAEEAYPRLLELIKSNRASNPIALIEAFPRFGRPESIPVLEEILARGQGTATGAASLSLARHPQDSARQALIRALTFPKAESVVAAADGLMSRGDRTACAELVKHLNRVDSTVRYHVIQAASRLGCLSSEALTRISNDDPDSDIRQMASRAMDMRPREENDV
ncbi:MAG: HEAT repeat domain-containing protein [Blastocatellia bacterium]